MNWNMTDGFKEKTKKSFADIIFLLIVGGVIIGAGVAVVAVSNALDWYKYGVPAKAWTEERGETFIDYRYSNRDTFVITDSGKYRCFSSDFRLCVPIDEASNK